MRLVGKVAVITGAGSGIGWASALLFAREGARVVVANRNAQTARETVEEIRRAGGEAIHITTDVSKESEVADLIRATVDAFGRLDILFNNAGIYLAKPLEEMSEQEWDESMDVNLKGVFFGCKYAIPEMRKNGGGSIVNTSSAAGLVASPRSALYAATKWGVIGLTKSLAIALGKDNIRVNAVCPGPTDTAMTPLVYSDTSEEGYRKRVSRYPLGKSGRPEDIAEAALFLASDAAAYITGVALPVDGGLTAQ